MEIGQCLLPQWFVKVVGDLLLAIFVGFHGAEFFSDEDESDRATVQCEHRLSDDDIRLFR